MITIIHWVFSMCQMLCEELSMDYFIQSSQQSHMVGTLIISIFEKKKSDLQKG